MDKEKLIVELLKYAKSLMDDPEGESILKMNVGMEILDVIVESEIN